MKYKVCVMCLFAIPALSLLLMAGENEKIIGGIHYAMIFQVNVGLHMQSFSIEIIAESAIHLEEFGIVFIDMLQNFTQVFCPKYQSDGPTTVKGVQCDIVKLMHFE